MRRLALTFTLPILAALGAGTGTALAVTPGHNQATKTLEGAFKIAQFERAHSADGCYPGPAAMASAIEAGTNLEADVASGLKAVNKPRVVYVIKRGANCGHVTLAGRFKGRLWVLDSTEGTVEAQGRGGGASNRRDVAIGGAGPLRAITTAKKTLQLDRSDEALRGIVLCPKGTYPLGGGMTATPALGPDGEGIYPHSFERLGAQRGWHINPVLIDPSVLIDHDQTKVTARSATISVICGKGLVPARAPRKTVFLKSGATGTATARCPKGHTLMAGGFQRTTFRTPGGSYVTESRAVGTRSWRVTGKSFGNAGGELTAIAYCDKGKRPLLATVTASNPLPAGQAATATTPACPKGRRLTSTGFTFNGSNDALFAGSSINGNGTSTATGYGYFGPAPSITAFGYCLAVAKGA